MADCSPRLNVRFARLCHNDPIMAATASQDSSYSGRYNSALSTSWSDVARFSAIVDSYLGKWLAKEYGIGLSEHRALTHLAIAPNRELRLNELASRIGLNQSSISRLIARLEAGEYTFRDSCPDDGRGVYAVITDKGLALLDQMHNVYEEKIYQLLSDPTEHLPEAVTARRSLEVVSKLVN